MPKKTKTVSKTTSQPTIMTPGVTPTPMPVASAPPAPMSTRIWNDIRHRAVGLFGIAGKVVEDYCYPVPIEPSRCFLIVKASALLPALEEVLGEAYTCEAQGKYVVISRTLEK